jgi:hypothetical protein
MSRIITDFCLGFIFHQGGARVPIKLLIFVRMAIFQCSLLLLCGKNYNSRPVLTIRDKRRLQLKGT